MLGRLFSLIMTGALAALAVLIYDPTLYGPEAPVVTFGEFEVFRPAILLAVALLALAAFFATVLPRPRSRPKPPFAPLSLQAEAPAEEVFAAEPFTAQPFEEEVMAAVEAETEPEPAIEPEPERRSPFEASVQPLSFGGGSARPSPVW